ncbi:MAG: 3-methyl-2-oxobutanoate hydroxymethyltransferase [Gammaproteobacteria bacterium]|nr:MAG: 3-methyl-2-oxobutanoate hydroxymethyltransferase [Gammaproteobacteria bacterium]
MNRKTVTTLHKMKADREKIAAITAYDASLAHVCEMAGVDLLLVGDSLAMVVQGHENTLPVTVDEMVYHTACVSRASRQALLVADMPFMAYATTDRALETAERLMKQGGAQMVKLEGGVPQLETVRYLSERGIPVCGHLGLTPQSVHRLGGYRVQGRDQAAARAMLEESAALQQAGAQLLVLECVPGTLANEISRNLEIPVIGIGAGPDTDGQVLVLYDVLGISVNRIPKFARDFMREAKSVEAAVRAYVEAVRRGDFPGPEHSFE